MRADKNEKSPTNRAAIGFRGHSGWAAAVAVTGSLHKPVVLARRRIELVDSSLPRQPYHAAEMMELTAAERFIRQCTKRAQKLAREAFCAMLEELEAAGYAVQGCGLLLGSGHPLKALEATLASHALIHTAEGELFREAISHASAHFGLSVTGVKERELLARAAETVRSSPGEIKTRLAQLGRSVGPPWTQDQKYAALVAWMALSAVPK
jgi:hypothetical protein